MLLSYLPHVPAYRAASEVCDADDGLPQQFHKCWRPELRESAERESRNRVHRAQAIDGCTYGLFRHEAARFVIPRPLVQIGDYEDALEIRVPRPKHLVPRMQTCAEWHCRFHFAKRVLGSSHLAVAFGTHACAKAHCLWRYSSSPDQPLLGVPIREGTLWHLSAQDLTRFGRYHLVVLVAQAEGIS